jgi:hypothetical protein
MEVHHHPDLHHKKKRFKEYFLEFLMIFLAVTLGFFAESLREHIADHNKEVEYMQSFVTDIQNDSSELSAKQSQLAAFPEGLNQLAAYCNQPDIPDSIQKLMYILNLKYLSTMHVYFTDKTTLQLKNSGGMRLIKNKIVGDAIAQYWHGIDEVDHTYENYENYRKPLRQLSFKIFNYTSYKKISTATIEFAVNRPELNVKDPLVLKEFGSEVWLLGSNIHNFYLPVMASQKKMADSVIRIIRKEYNF